jgi:hypothetical protein
LSDDHDYLQRLGDELQRAIEAKIRLKRAADEKFRERLGDELERAVEQMIQHESTRRRWLPRQPAWRVLIIGAAMMLVLGGTAFATQAVFGIINLGNGLRAQQVTSVPDWDGISGSFVSTSQSHGYVYHVVGGTALELSCGPEDLSATNNIYVRSKRPLDESELKELLVSQFVQTPLSLEQKAIAALRARHHGHPRRAPNGKALPAGVLSVSNGCPDTRTLTKGSPFSALPVAGDSAAAVKRPAP